MKPSLVLELVGPAGAGKTTLAEAMRACDQRVRSSLGLWGLPRPFLLAEVPSLVGPALGATFHRENLRPAELAQMLRLAALRRAVRRRQNGGSGVIVLDEGPVFGLAWLQVNFGRNGRGPWSEWRRRTIAEWAAALDMVVRMDAPDPVLTRRIRDRSKPHPVKHLPDDGIGRFSDAFRRGFDQVIEDLTREGRVRVIDIPAHLDGPPEESAVRVLSLLRPYHAH